MEGRQKFMMFAEIAKLAIEHGGTVFGGYVRDFIRHEDASKRYYAQKHTSEQYTDPEISPDTIDRLLIPSDIDVKFETFLKYKDFRFALRDLLYTTQIVKKFNMYTPGDTCVKHMRMRVGVDHSIDRIIRSTGIKKSTVAGMVLIPELRRCLEGMSIPTDFVEIDILLTTREPPFNKLDFECNGLIMDKDGIHLCHDLKGILDPFGIFRTYSRIMEDIIAKRAVLVNLIPNRWDKMDNKGWDLVGGTVEKVKLQTGSEYDQCLICHQTIDQDESYRLECCKNVYYHFECLARQITYPVTGIVDSGKCTHCRRNIFLGTDEVRTFGALIQNV